MRRLFWMVCALGLLGLPGSSYAEDFFIDPTHGSRDGDGSIDRPWRTLEEVWADGLIETRRFAAQPWVDGTGYVAVNPGAPVQPGDTLWLATGSHGQLTMTGAHNAAPIQVAALPGHTPEIGQVSLLSVSGWVFDGLHVRAPHGGELPEVGLIDVDGNNWWGPSADVTIAHCDIATDADATTWDVLGWETSPRTGVTVTGSGMHLVDNTIHDVFHGVILFSEDNHATHNLVDRFGGDGVRVLGDHSSVTFNVIRNALGGTDPSRHNHDDGIQSWSVGATGPGSGVVSDVTITHNLVIHLDDPSHPARGSYFQGLGFFDGFYDDFVIQNNVIVCDASHGVTLLGSRNARIVNNTVLATDIGESVLPHSGPATLQVRAHKDGRPSTGGVIRNNVACGVRGDGDTATDHNITLNPSTTDHLAHFADPGRHDYQLLATSTAVDGGSSDQAPATDHWGRARPVGGAIDIGAFEHGASGEVELPGPRAVDDEGPIYPPGDDTGVEPTDTGPTDTGPADTGVADTDPGDATEEVDLADIEEPLTDTSDTDTSVPETDTSEPEQDTSEPETDASVTEDAADTQSADARTDTSADTQAGAEGEEEPLPECGSGSGCACTAAPHPARQPVGWILAGLALWHRRRRRRSPDSAAEADPIC